ncbi:hypothetical protein CO583_00225 [Parasaccharibacter sp. TMW2.1882]|uniref:Glycosyltransferase family 8 protein n=2 Tax=Acetobacteraceae TaxID=433 RepID=A0ABX4ZLH9_9PROT|nr:MULTISPECIES: glycosyltransferase [Acetobacteraceae]MCQ0041030.1 hypothetical protein [Bombella sp.]MUG79657.1 hypothetical protein [Bombella sp. ESL0380]MBE1723555.1 hypothetical protein [Bombella apis]MBR9729980.1 hypothetical protein [Bombella apis]MCK8636948.1 hypothetical protein [Parasaccharibacter sp. TMW2.1885]
MSTFPIVVSFDKKYLIPALVTIKSILDHCSDTSRIEFFVLYRNLDTTLIRLTEQVVASFGSVISFIDCSSFMESLNFANNENRPLETYVPLFIPTIFKGYEKVLSIDVDMLVRDDVLKIINEIPQNKKLGGVRCLIRNHRKYEDFGDFNKFSRNMLGINNPYFYVNSGLILFNMDAITDADAAYCIECIKKKWLFYDESILNHVFKDSLHHFSQSWNLYAEYLHTNYLEFEYSMQEQVKKAQEDASIIHYVADTKPWDHPAPDTTDKYRLEYRALVAAVKDEIRNILPRTICGVMWNRVDRA